MRSTPFFSLRRISFRFLLFILPFIFLLCLAVYIIIPQEHIKQGNQAVVEKALNIAGISAYSLGPAVYLNDREAMQEVFSSARQSQDVLYLLVADSSEKVIAAYNKPEADRAHYLEVTGQNIPANDPVYRFSVPIRFQGKQVGRFYLGLSLEALRKQDSLYRRSIALASLLFFIVGATIIVVLSAWTTKPLRRVTGTAKQIAAGDLSQRAPVASGDEVGQLARSFNIMVDHLEEARRTLETRVSERTRELENEIAERHKAEDALRKSEEMFRSMMEKLGDGVGIVDAQENFIYANPSAHEIFRLPPAQLIGRSLRDFASPDQQSLIQLQTRNRQKGEKGDYELNIIRTDRAQRTIRVNVIPLLDAKGQYTSALGVFADVTERKLAEEAVREANEKLNRSVKELESRHGEMIYLSQLYESIQAARQEKDICDIAAEYARKLFPEMSGVLFMYKASKNLLEKISAWGTGSDPDFIHPDDCWALRSGKLYAVEGLALGRLCAHVMNPGPPVAPYLCIPMPSREGILGFLHLRYSPEPGSHPPSGQGYSVIKAREQLAVNFVERISLAMVNFRLSESLKQQSIRDPLTGLFNRRYMEETLEREIFRAARNKDFLGIMMIDIDFFKRFNDARGHEAGDKMLRAVAEFLQQQVRKEDVVCRYGGEEFTIILPGASPAVTRVRAVRILEGVRDLKFLHMNQTAGSLTLSIGIACFPEEGQLGADVLAAADAALLKAKKAGRDRVVDSGGGDQDAGGN